MSLKKYFTKKNLIIAGIVSIGLIFLLQYLTSKNITNKNLQTTPLNTISTTPKPVYDTSESSSTEIEAFLKEYKFMFYHLPDTNGATSLGWDKDVPFVVQGTSIVNVLKNKSVLDSPEGSITLLNNQGMALIVSIEDTAMLFKDIDKTKIPASESTRNSFSYIWYQQPNQHLVLSSDQKTLLLVDDKENTSVNVYVSDSEINPLSISTDGTQIAFTDKNNLYLSTPNQETKKTKLSDTTTESITFWLNKNLFLVEKVTLPRVLDFVLYVDQKDLSFKQIITSSSIVGRINLNIRPSINQKEDMVLFAENNGLVWLLSRDQAITRIYPKLKLPADMWGKSF